MRREASDFAVTTLSGEEIELTNWRGKGVFLTFWATWAAPSKKQLTSMNGLYPQYQGRGVEMIALNANELEVEVANYVHQQAPQFPIAIDSGGTIGEQYGVEPLPTSFVIDAEGFIVDQCVGELTVEQLETQLAKVVAR